MTLPELIAQARSYLNPTDVQVVIYHSPCPDGFGSAFSAWHFLGDENAAGEKITYIPMKYGMQYDPELVKDKNVVMADFSFKRPQLLELQALCNKLLVLDHHKTAEAELENLEGCFFSMPHSGAMMAWEYFNLAEKPCPDFIKWIEDRDLWRWTYKEQSKPFQAVIEEWMQQSEDPLHCNFRDLAKYLQPEVVVKALEDGNKILQEQKAWIVAKAPEAKAGTFTAPNKRQYQVLHIALEDSKLISELAEYLYLHQQADFVLLWHPNSEGMAKISLRTPHKHVDVSDVAKQFPGGGGHAKAAGLAMPVAELNQRLGLQPAKDLLSGQEGEPSAEEGNSPGKKRIRCRF